VNQLGAEEDLMHRMLGEISPGDVFYDVGASIGMAGIHAAAAGASVVAFEPDPHIAGRLRQNADLNPGIDLTVVEAAVAEKQGWMELHTNGLHGNSPSLRSVGDRPTTRVRVTSIDETIATGYPKPRIMKIDVEGAEVRVIRGMDNLLRSAPPKVLYIEVHPEFLPMFGDSIEELRARLEEAGLRRDFSTGRFSQIHEIYRLAA